MTVEWCPCAFVESFKDSCCQSTFEFFILEKYSCLIVVVVFLLLLLILSNHQDWFPCDFVKKMTFFLSFISHLFIGAAGLLQSTCSWWGRMPSVDSLVGRCIFSAPLSIKSTITICLQFISNVFTIDVSKHMGALHLCICLQITLSSVFYVNLIIFYPRMDK